MSDVMLRFSPGVLIAGAYLILGPLLAGLVMLARAIGHRGRMRWMALAGAGLATVFLVDLVFHLGPEDGPEIEAVRVGMLAGTAIAWLATAVLARSGRWMDLSVALGPLVAGLALVWLEHG